MAVPTPQEQVEFLQRVQRLLTEGRVSSSYKYALLLSLIGIAVDKGDDTGNELKIELNQLAESFIDLYWRQVAPFKTTPTDSGGVLKQYTGTHAAIISEIAEFRRDGQESLRRYRTYASWQSLVDSVGDRVDREPLRKLQNVGQGFPQFLYPYLEGGHAITLNPGVVFCLRKFSDFLRYMVMGQWVSYVLSRNRDLLGNASEMGKFLFGSDRDDLSAYRPLLLAAQEKRCLYCRQQIEEPGQVDHFIPWARYPIDLGHNLVLAHGACNGQKSDHIAAEDHLDAWMRRNESKGAELTQRFNELDLQHDSARSLSIARWAYGQTANINGLTWIKGEELVQLRGDWRSLLGAA